MTTVSADSTDSPGHVSSIRVALLAFSLAFASGCGPGESGEPGEVSRTPDRVVGEDGATEPAGVGGGSVANAEERRLLNGIVAAETGVSFAGWKTAFHGPRETSRATRIHIHRGAPGRTIATWESRSGAGEGGRADGAEPRRRRYLYAHRRETWIARPDLLLANYRVVAVPDAVPPVAGRATRCVHFEPRRDGRPSVELQLDVETSLPLAETRRDRDGNVTFSWKFETLEFDPEPLELSPDEVETIAAPGEVPEGACSFDALLVEAVPAGFRRVGCRVLPCGGLREYWSDGLAAFAVAQTAVDEDSDCAPAAGEIQRRTAGERSHVRGRFGHVVVDVLGAVALDELEAVVRGMMQRGAPSLE